MNSKNALEELRQIRDILISVTKKVVENPVDSGDLVEVLVGEMPKYLCFG